MNGVWRETGRLLSQSKLRARAWIAGAGGLALAVGMVLPTEATATNGSRLNPPMLTCADATQVSLDVQVCGGASGTPAGFVLRWLEGEEWLADAIKCTAHFGRFAQRLKPGQCITVNLGELLADQSNNTTCTAALKCGTTYTIKGWAKATATKQISLKSAALSCSTLECSPPGDGCTFTQGYWKAHGPTPKGNNEYVWPQSVKDDGLFIGNPLYTAVQLLSIFNQEPKGNGLVSLAHQLIAAKLNIANGANPSAIAATITAADALIGALIVPPIGGGELTPAQTSALNDALTDYNEGATGPGHCPPTS